MGITIDTSGARPERRVAGSTRTIDAYRQPDTVLPQLASAVFADFGSMTDSERNCVRLVFTHPSVRQLYSHGWEDAALGCVAFLRMDAARDQENPRLASLVEELSQDPDFRRWWARTT